LPFSWLQFRLFFLGLAGPTQYLNEIKMIKEIKKVRKTMKERKILFPSETEEGVLRAVEKDLQELLKGRDGEESQETHGR